MGKLIKGSETGFAAWLIASSAGESCGDPDFFKKREFVFWAVHQSLVGDRVREYDSMFSLPTMLLNAAWGEGGVFELGSFGKETTPLGLFLSFTRRYYERGMSEAQKLPDDVWGRGPKIYGYGAEVRQN